jgi:nucleotide-binding universal stress UspA family protein
VGGQPVRARWADLRARLHLSMSTRHRASGHGDRSRPDEAGRPVVDDAGPSPSQGLDFLPCRPHRLTVTLWDMDMETVEGGVVDGRPTIVVGVDGSDEARTALEFALDDAGRRNARVRVVSVFEEPDYWAVSYGMSPPAPLQEVTVGLEKATQQVVDVVRAGHPDRAAVPVDVLALVGPPAKVLLEQARDADLLVLGHRGRGGFASAMLGSVGLQCVLHGSGPVTIVRPDKHPGPQP